MKGLVGQREDLGFYPEGGGSPGGCEQRRGKVHLTSEFGKMLSPKQYLSPYL